MPESRVLGLLASLPSVLEAMLFSTRPAGFNADSGSPGRLEFKVGV